MESKGSLPFPTSGNCFYELSAQWEKHYEPIWSLAVTLCWTPLEALERLFWWTSHLFSLISHFRQIINPRGHAQVSNWERLCMPWHPRQWRASSPLYGVSHKKSCRLLGAYELTGAVPSTVNAGIFTLWSGHHFFFLTDVKTKIQSDYVTLHVESLAKARLELESNAVRLPPWLSTCHVHLSVLWARRAGFPHVLGWSLEIVAQPTFLFMKVWGLTILWSFSRNHPSLPAAPLTYLQMFQYMAYHFCLLALEGSVPCSGTLWSSPLSRHLCKSHVDASSSSFYPE